MSLILTDKNDFQDSSYFLLSTQLAEQGRKMPIKWMAPESLHQRRFSSASDVWMFAVCIWEILSKGVKPFSNLTNAEAVEQIARGVRLERPDKCPHSLYEILLQCWNANPTLRPTFSMLKPRIRELTIQYKSTSASLEPMYLNCGKFDIFCSSTCCLSVYLLLSSCHDNFVFFLRVLICISLTNKLMY
ncbi:unnamed protein product [Schistosoma margrebowiei]|uniref:Uncharacterized protein n=1 Tax=Schistosoma margrebowiei TaxID=48269 RepID=A0A183M2W6_9TREM|nr:unnamed protein product [Schistosoma margrebowiei]